MTNNLFIKGRKEERKKDISEPNAKLLAKQLSLGSKNVDDYWRQRVLGHSVSAQPAQFVDFANIFFEER